MMHPYINIYIYIIIIYIYMYIYIYPAFSSHRGNSHESVENFKRLHPVRKTPFSDRSNGSFSILQPGSPRKQGRSVQWSRRRKQRWWPSQVPFKGRWSQAGANELRYLWKTSNYIVVTCCNTRKPWLIYNHLHALSMVIYGQQRVNINTPQSRFHGLVANPFHCLPREAKRLPEFAWSAQFIS